MREELRKQAMELLAKGDKEGFIKKAGELGEIAMKEHGIFQKKMVDE